MSMGGHRGVVRSRWGLGGTLPAGQVHRPLAPKQRLGLAGMCRKRHCSAGSGARRPDRRAGQAGGNLGYPWAKPGWCRLHQIMAQIL